MSQNSLRLLELRDIPLFQNYTLSIVLEDIQGGKCNSRSGGWNRQQSRASERLPSIRAGEEDEQHRYQGHDCELKDVLSYIVRLGWLRISANHSKQRCKRQDDENYDAYAVDLLHKHRVDSLSVCRPRISPSRWSVSRSVEANSPRGTFTSFRIEPITSMFGRHACLWPGANRLP